MNSIICEEKRESWAQIWEAGVHLADDFAAANCKGETTNAGTTAGTSNSAGRWQIPETWYMKVNIDATFNATTNYGAVGLIGRNDKGELWGAQYTRITHVGSPLLAECLAMREGIEFAWKHKWRRIILEVDSKLPIQVLNEKFRVPEEVTTIAEDIPFLSRHMDVKFQYVSLVFNNAAHTVAHWDHGGSMEFLWLHQPPLWLLPAFFMIYHLS
ncbi:hypothetical protein LIER_31033 [Lithospermum erythrorhizon]|uniref:RNase H type-1 domain-containing protein n=1 Tax=Lithospermum erythrorhizon TaxID=34254 RepID=A0AAV3RRN9_LITER